MPSGLLTERELRWMGVGAPASRPRSRVGAAAARGWWLLFGLGVIGAVAYTLPPVRAAYVPFAGEAVAFGCGLACTVGAMLQASVSGRGAWPARHAAFCVGMLMLHHYLDRGPDSRALPPKGTSVVRLGHEARRYASPGRPCPCSRSPPSPCGSTRASPSAPWRSGSPAAHATVAPDDPASVTRAELAVILLGMAGGLGTAAALVPALAWALLPPAVLVPLELRVSGLAHRALFDEARAWPPRPRAPGSRPERSRPAPRQAALARSPEAAAARPGLALQAGELRRVAGVRRER